ncbi:hypothetical protein DMB66_57625 [Actinoplanes sp. ATCC 53533]|uniref:hypothetical protein n=1 Tax=Actinoplanes sp. ATCC 53533 TaxID=1288362 RepID=UPI000F79229C|nr:hypothetical protein [Actinoplanes sp. ATCC 53533]RSM40068.1 hypothetical protein DMB66_57625 [Actinoplanes sp. ATCC 53533]
MTRVRRAAIAFVVATGAILAAASPAAAATNDSFGTSTNYPPSKCSNPNSPAGAVDFVDFGPGAPGGGNNDDYLEIKDLCGDGDGVRAYAWLNGKYLGTRHNGLASGSTVTWDPFPDGNVRGGDTVSLKVCSVNGFAGTPYNCAELAHKSVDG